MFLKSKNYLSKTFFRLSKLIYSNCRYNIIKNLNKKINKKYINNLQYKYFIDYRCINNFLVIINTMDNIFAIIKIEVIFKK